MVISTTHNSSRQIPLRLTDPIDFVLRQLRITASILEPCAAIIDSLLPSLGMSEDAKAQKKNVVRVATLAVLFFTNTLQFALLLDGIVFTGENLLLIKPLVKKSIFVLSKTLVAIFEAVVQAITGPNHRNPYSVERNFHI